MNFPFKRSLVRAKLSALTVLVLVTFDLSAASSTARAADACPCWTPTYVLDNCERPGAFECDERECSIMMSCRGKNSWLGLVWPSAEYPEAVQPNCEPVTGGNWVRLTPKQAQACAAAMVGFPPDRKRER